MPIRTYSLVDVIKALNNDSTPYVEPNPGELISQFMQAQETLKVQSAWTANVYTPYPWLVNDLDGPVGYWMLGDAATATSAFDSNPYGPKVPGSIFGGVAFNQSWVSGIGQGAAAFGPNTTLNAALASGTNYTSLTVVSAPAIPSGATLVINQGGSSSQTVTTSSSVLSGATTIPVNSFNANANYGIGTTVLYIGDIDVPFNAAHNPSPAFMVEAWVYKTAYAPAGNEGIVETRPSNSGASSAGYMLAIGPSGAVVFVVCGNSTQYSVTSTTLLSLNAWHHLVGIYDGTNLSLYIDGSLAAGPTAGTYAANTTRDLTIGRNIIGGVYTFSTSISNVAVYPVADATMPARHFGWSSQPNFSASYRYGLGSITKYGKFTYPNPPQRGANRWGSAVWGSFVWG